MCCGVLYDFEGIEKRILFESYSATLPVVLKTKIIKQVEWGRRKFQLGRLPLGGWARLESINKGAWDIWQPIPVKIPVKAFMEVTHEGREDWFNVISYNYIQGLIARDKYEQRVYVVTIDQERADSFYYRWPKIINANN